jgi:hypothetical protein
MFFFFLPLINNDFPKSSWPLNVRGHMHLIRLLLTWDKEFSRLIMKTHSERWYGHMWCMYEIYFILISCSLVSLLKTTWNVGIV